ncbi:MAG: hypothetical protein FWD48_11810 [Oscillospiraceae bacterium]|nr:hypothetical protein [Oscillospiraceae bacterium]
MFNEYVKLDEIAMDGVFAVPSVDDFDMLAMRKYCKEKNKPYNELTDEEIGFFTLQRQGREAM